MNYLKIKNKKLYKVFKNNEIKRVHYKFVFYNTKLPENIRQAALTALQSQGISDVQIKQRCYITNRSRSVFKNFKISRIKLRTLISNNFINSVKKYNK
jgi:ribosomal protein S14